MLQQLSMAAAEQLRAGFGGIIARSHAAQAEFREAAAVLMPNTVEQVQSALKLAQAAGQTLFVRSGSQMRGGERTRAPGLTLSMENFNQIETAAKQLTVGAAATVGALARTLAQRGLYLPLGDQGSQSIAAALLERGLSPLLRSGKPQRSLAELLTAAQVVVSPNASPSAAPVACHSGLPRA
jgi:FAD/FMN-containing dehydrogenase